MSASIAISAGASAQAAAAAAMAAKAHDEACRVVLSTYNPTTATVEQMHDYADCINRMHPTPLTGGEVLGLKIVIVITLLAAVFGAYRPLFSYDPTPSERVLGGILAAIMAICATVLLAVVFTGILFLFT